MGEDVTRPFKRIVAMADTHCGHWVGLTPPEWQNLTLAKKYLSFQQEMWQWYAETLAKLKPIDVLLFLGDAIDGKGERSGGTELITTDRTIQAEMAEACIKEAEADHVRMIFGTPYHTGANEDWEKPIAKALKVSIKGHDWVDVNGVKFDLKHYIGGSQIPHGRFTAIGKDMLWNLLWSVDGRQEKADIILRAHVHYAVDVGELGLGRRGIILPGLQGYGSKFGIRRCSGRIDIGFVHFDVYGKGKYNWEPHLFESSILKISATKLG